MYLQENLFEPITRLYFSTARKFQAPFEAGEEGLHFEDNLTTLNRVIKGLRADKKYKYSIDLSIDLEPLYIDDDILFWSGPNIAELFLCKLDNKNYSAAFKNQPAITPDLVEINIVELDREILNNIKQQDSTPESFSEIMQFIYSKGFNCISYLIYEGNGIDDRAILLDTDAPFDYTSIEEI